MTLYELVKSIPQGELGRLGSAGVVNRAIPHQLYVYEMYLDLLAKDMPKMQIYTTISETCYTSEDNVRKIIQKYSKEAR